MQPSNVRFLHSAPRARARGTDQQEDSAVSVLVAKRRARARWFVGALALAAVIGTFASIESNLDREIRDLPTAQRTALYLRTLDTLRTTCEQVARGATMTEYCREQAKFIERFPECDAACHKVAMRFGPTPSR